MGETSTSWDIESQNEASSIVYLIWVCQEIKHNLLKRVCKCLHFYNPIAICSKLYPLPIVILVDFYF